MGIKSHQSKTIEKIRSQDPYTGGGMPRINARNRNISARGSITIMLSIVALHFFCTPSSECPVGLCAIAEMI